MRYAFYPKLALDGMKKNSRLYVPYLLTGAGMAAMFYILYFLSRCAALDALRGAESLRSILELGTWVVAAFSLLFLFYTNAFLMRRRKKEFGLLNVLGLGKRNLGAVLFWESVVSAAVSIFAGLFVGVVLSKAAELGLVRLLQGEAGFDFPVSIEGLCHTVCVYCAIYLLLFLNGLRQIRFSTALSLLGSERAGERPPRGNWFLGLLGLAALGAAYYLAVTIEDPLVALAAFFIAVLLVIAATYLLMVAGSVLLCRLLQRNKRYYYRPNHFISVSSMAFRMKRNGAGLASICILATMVLVMLSSTTALYFGAEDALRARYPREFNLTSFFPDVDDLSGEKVEPLRTSLLSAAAGEGAMVQNVLDCRAVTVPVFFRGGVIEPGMDELNNMGLESYGDLAYLSVYPLADYNAATGTDWTLGGGEALLYAEGANVPGETVSIQGGPSFRVAGRLAEAPDDGGDDRTISTRLALVVADFAGTARALEQVCTGQGTFAPEFRWTFGFDAGLNPDGDAALLKACRNVFRAFSEEQGWDVYSYRFSCRDLERPDYLGTFGGFFYLGILLSVVFLFATVLIIYYKQITEGYEDQSRFELMRKVGLTRREIRKSVNSQLLTVFFLPLLGAGLHLTFAFPMVQKLLMLFGLTNVPLFAATTGISFLIFALFYLLVYRGTSNAYYKIVSYPASKSL